tara:strand:+ start:1792 stop:2454 length:663 start_codon:yes stop_codon:yes gene_type:complete
MSLHDKKYIVIRKILSDELVKIYYDYIINKEKVCITMLDNRFINPFSKDYGIFNDPQVPHAYSLYGDLLFDNMMIDLKPRIEKETGLELTEMYSYARNYRQRDELKRHKDRGSCEISGTINLGGDLWPIYIDPNPENGYYDKENEKYISPGEKGIEVLLEPGDCMIYLGCENEHWRNPLLDKGCSQVFIHYRQTKDIKSNEELWDTRLGPGMPGYTKKDK